MALYHPSIYDTAEPAGSYWEASAGSAPKVRPPLEGGQSCDLAIIGGGYTGLNAAYHATSEIGASVRVLEAGTIGWGASGRNGGFCSIGSAKLSWSEMARRYGRDAARAFFGVQRQAIEHVRELTSREGIAIDARGEGDLDLAHRSKISGIMRTYAKETNELLGANISYLEGEDLAAYGVRNSRFFAALYIPYGFALHPLKYVRGLAAACDRRGAIIHERSQVLSWRQEAGAHILRTDHGELRAKRVILATNGYSSDGLHSALSGRFLPVISNILVTRPLSAEEQAAGGWTTDLMASDSRNLLHYFRLLSDGRFLFGGRGGTTGSPAGRERMRRRLRNDFETMFPAWSRIETPYFWRGLVCVARDRVPHIVALDADGTAWTALAYHGNGVAMGSWSGRTLARLAFALEPKERLLPAMLRNAPPRFPLPALRLFYLRAAYAGFKLKDEWL